MSGDTLHTAVAQFAASNHILENQANIQALAEQAAVQGAELLVLPEASMCSFASELAELRHMAQEHTPSFTQFMQALARQHQLHIIVGVLSLSPEIGEKRVSNQLLLIDDQGVVCKRYNKIHVYDAFKFKESDKVKPGAIHADGSGLGVFKIKNFTIGLINCYDLRFPELARLLIDKGVNVLSVSANWIPGAYKEMHWEILLRARAIENSSYVLASGQTAPRGIGQSMIIDPMGTVMSNCADLPTVQVQTLSIERLKQVRELLPCLQNRRL